MEHPWSLRPQEETYLEDSEAGVADTVARSVVRQVGFATVDTGVFFRRGYGGRVAWAPIFSAPHFRV